LSTAIHLLEELAVIGARIESAGDRIILRAGATAIPAGLVGRVREAKSELLATLMCVVPVGTSHAQKEWTGSEAELVAPSDWFQHGASLVEGETGLGEPCVAIASAADLALVQWGDAEDERAAIVEYDRGVPRDWAEGFARLDCAKPPADVSSHRWRLFIDDCGRFLDEGWAHCAMSLGWRALDLFGCDRERPFARLDHAGLLWLIDGRKLVALTANTATIETATGVRQTYYRRPAEPGAVVLAWQVEPMAD
jgi:hypothetical protein